ncbi:membrane protein containing Acyltransferase 3 domain protein [gut metagenome]|uniref:Membrane protein containing Acyltransferase 3 domain protein n=1 Tax=gut metagenome TaxID=749906 RepID=J9F395_9ZZZZ
MKQRITSIDYIRCICILLMVIFHLAYIGDKYPYAKQFVYTFHMPAFLIISGYLVNMTKTPAAFLKTICWIFIPYAIMETGYITLSAILPVREKVESLSLPLFLDKLFIHPLGPYWYLHTWMICSLTCYTINRFLSKSNPANYVLFSGITLWMLSYLGWISMANAIYFLFGVAIQRYKADFSNFFQPTLVAILPICLLMLFKSNLNRYSLGGIALTYAVISLLLAIYPYLTPTTRSASQYIGRNTLPILLFSPIFTMLSKSLIPLLTFDSTGLIYMTIATTAAILGSFAIAWCMDKFKLSTYFCNRNLLH